MDEFDVSEETVLDELAAVLFDDELFEGGELLDGDELPLPESPPQPVNAMNVSPATRRFGDINIVWIPC